MKGLLIASLVMSPVGRILFLPLLCLCFDNGLMIYIPGVTEHKQTAHTSAIDTSGWQGRDAIEMHHNYSKVAVYTKDSNTVRELSQTHTASTHFKLGANSLSGRGEDVEEIDIFGPKKHYEEDNEEELITPTYPNFSFRQPKLKIQNFDAIHKDENAIQDQRIYQDAMIHHEEVHEKPATVKFFYPLKKPIYVHGFKYPAEPDHAIQVYQKCPKMATGQYVYASACNQFLNCWKGRGYVQSCAPGTLFNPKTLECDFAAKVQCISGPKNYYDAATITTSNQSQEKNRTGCPAGYNGVVPHHYDCAKFLNCADGVEHAMDCPVGTLFSVRRNLCDYPDSAECAQWCTTMGDVRMTPKYNQTDDLYTVYVDSHDERYKGYKYPVHVSEGQGRPGQAHAQGQSAGTPGYTVIYAGQQGSTGHASGSHSTKVGQPTLVSGDSQGFADQTGFDSNGDQVYGRPPHATSVHQSATTNTGHVSGTPGYTVLYKGQQGNTALASGGQSGNHKQPTLASGDSQGFADQTGFDSSGDQVYGRPLHETNVHQSATTNIGHVSVTPGYTVVYKGQQGNTRPASGGQSTIHRQPKLASGDSQGFIDQTGFDINGDQVYGRPLYETNYQANTQHNKTTKTGQDVGTPGYTVIYKGQQENTGHASGSPSTNVYIKGQSGPAFDSSGNRGYSRPSTQNTYVSSRPQQESNGGGLGQGYHPLEVSTVKGYFYPRPSVGNQQFDSSNNQNRPTYGEFPKSPQGSQGTFSVHTEGNRGYVDGVYHGTDQETTPSYGTDHNPARPSVGNNRQFESSSNQNRPTYGEFPKSPQGSQGTFSVHTKGNRGYVDGFYHGTHQGTTPSYGTDQNQGAIGGHVDDNTRDGRTYPEINDHIKCPADASGLYPHPNDCSKFLNCANGMTYVQDCGPGTLYNALANLCDHAHNVDCTYGRFINQYVRAPQHSPPEAKPTCPDGFNGLLPHPIICTKFLNCANGQMFIQDCGPGTAFNAQTQVCDWPYKVNCSRGGQREHSVNGQGHVQSTPRYDVYPGGYEATPRPTFVSGGYSGGHQSSAAPSYVRRNYTTVTRKPYPINSQSFDQEAFTSIDAPVQVEVDNQDVYPSKFEGRGLHGATTVVAQVDCIRNFQCSNRECVLLSKVCDGVKDCPEGEDELQCDYFMDQFTIKSNAILAVREVEKLVNVTPIACAKACVEVKSLQCKSFSYRHKDGACLLNNQNVASSGALIASYFFVYYELKAHTTDCTSMHVCPNGKCIPGGKICDGVNDCVDRSDEKGCAADVLGYAVRLQGSDRAYEGRLEVEVFGQRGYICDDKFGMRDANVVCQELGFPLGALEVRGNSFYNEGMTDENSTFYLMDDVACVGNESTLRDCDFNGWGVHNCEAQEVVGVVCKTPQQHCKDEEWRCGTGDDCIALAFMCDGVADCTDQSDEDDLNCKARVEVRLANGPSEKEGRLEVRYHGTWGTVCDDDFNEDAAKVVCNYMGFSGGAQVKKAASYGTGSGPIWLDQVYCQGNEMSLDDCYHWNWGENNCDHGEDVGVVCAVPDTFEDQDVERSLKIPDIETTPSSVFPETCGHINQGPALESDVDFRVVKGSVAPRGHYPWQASLRIQGPLSRKPSHWCGAVIIARQFLLTAAHCLTGFPKGAYLVTAGDYNVDVPEGTEQEVYIEEYYTHELFRSEHRMNNDIALIKLKGAGLTFTNDVQPICLPSADLDYERGQNCTISGFGSIESGKAAASRELRAGWVPMQPMSVCKMPQVYGDAITESMFCAGSLDEGVDACDGDSGGPLACLNEGVFTLYGLTSWGQHCGHANKPGVYVKVSRYLDWIANKLKQHSQNT